MRLYLFPITRQRTLIYCKRTQPVISAATQSSSSPSPTSTTQKPPRWWTSLDGVTGRANTVWVSWEAAPSGWKAAVVRQANKLFATIPYQEWGLKSIPPLPSKPKSSEGNSPISSQALADRRAAKVSVVYPTRLFQASEIPAVLKRLAGENQSLYRKRMWYSIVAMPFTLPFALVPIVPNLPFFYLVFRAWSYWRAGSGCAHIEHLLQKDLISASPNQVLQRLWDSGPVEKAVVDKLALRVEELKASRKRDGDKEAPEYGQPEDLDVEKVALEVLEDGPAQLPDPLGSTRGTSETPDGTELLLYPKGHGKLIGLTLNMPEVELELERAREQVAKVLAKHEPAEGGKEDR